MKKVFVLVAVAALFAVSCKDDTKGEVLAPDQEKETLDETCTKAIEMLSVENWQETDGIITGTAEVVSNINPDASLYEWLGNTMESFYVENEDYDLMIIDPSTVKGAFSVVNDTLYVAESNALTLDYALEDGTACKAAFDVKASSTRLLVNQEESISETGETTITGKTYLVVPESVNAQLNADGKKAVAAKLTAKVGVAGEVPAFNDTFEGTAEFECGSYTLAVTRAKYSTSEIALSTSFKYGKTTILAANFTAKGKLVFNAENEEPDLMKTTGKVDANIALLDNVELKGDFDWDKVKTLVGSPMSGTEASAKELAAKLEEYVHLTLYIQKTAQAKLGFEAVSCVEGGSIAEVVWDVKPVVRFEDGSQYQLPEEFFSPEGFPKTIEAVNNLLAEIEAAFNPAA